LGGGAGEGRVGRCLSHRGTEARRGKANPKSEGQKPGGWSAWVAFWRRFQGAVVLQATFPRATALFGPPPWARLYRPFGPRSTRPSRSLGDSEVKNGAPLLPIFGKARPCGRRMDLVEQVNSVDMMEQMDTMDDMERVGETGFWEGSRRTPTTEEVS
jgi:hypothetical protein